MEEDFELPQYSGAETRDATENGSKTGIVKLSMERQLRGVARGRITKLVQQIKDYFKNETDISIKGLELFLVKLNAAENHLNETNRACIPAITEANILSEFKTIDEYEETIIETKFHVTEKINEMKCSQSVSANESLNLGRMDIRDRNIIKMPKIEINKFYGEFTEWVSFWDQFCTTIHSNAEISSISKFNYLKTLLKGRAADAISGLSPSEENYKKAVDILKKEFSSVDRATEGYIKKLLDLPIVKDYNDVQNLRKVFNISTTTVRSLQSLKVSQDKYELVAKTGILRVLPREIVTGFYRSLEAKEDQDGSLEKLLFFLEIEVKSLERNAAFSKNSKGSSFSKVSKFAKQNFEQSTSRVGSATGLLSTSASSEQCLFCNSVNHKLNKCDKPMSISERKSILTKAKRCFRCTGIKHSARDCKTSNLKCDNCKGRHVTVMCDPDWKPKKDSDSTDASTDDKSKLSLISNNDYPNILLQTLFVKIFSKDRQSYCFRAILDGGSQLTYVKKSLVQQLGLPVIGKKDVRIVTFGSKMADTVRTYNVIELKLYSQFDDNNILIEAIEVPEICPDLLASPELNSLGTNKMLADVAVNPKSVIPGINLLIGANFYWRVVSEEKERVSDRLMAINTRFGWTLHGGTGKNGKNDYDEGINMSISLTTLNEDTLDFDLEKFWNLESMGIGINEVDLKTDEFTYNNISFVKDRFQVTLPWKNTDIIDTNKRLANLSLKSLVKKLTVNETDLENYDRAIREFIENGWAKIVSPVECENLRTYYMPHRGVYREDRETTKLRVVFNASSHRAGSESLNDLLHTGANLNTPSLIVALNFRIGAFAIIADIEKAFLQIALAPEEWNSHRFLWYANIKDLSQVTEYCMTRLTFGVRCSPFVLAAVLHKMFNEIKSFKPYIGERILKSFYVDDFAISDDDISLLSDICLTVISVCNRASMNVRKWVASDSKLYDIVSSKQPELKLKKVLGLIWNLEQDMISVDISAPIDYYKSITNLTKRVVLQFVSRIYDPLGLLAPYTINFKFLIQDLWKEKLSWDEDLSSDIKNKFLKVIKNFEKLSEFKVDRYVSFINKDYLEIHIFADASVKGYGAVAYLRTVNNDNRKVTSNLICSKNRIAPLDSGNIKLTLPRLELTACLVAVRLYEFLKRNIELKIDRFILWSDSQIALSWIMSSLSKLDSYVRNRVKEIKEKFTDNVWCHCPGTENPSDLITRGISVNTLMSSNLWLHGPNWLTELELSLPLFESSNCLISTAAPVDYDDNKIEALFKLDRYSNFNKIIHVTCYIIRCCSSLKHNHKEVLLSAEEIMKAELYWIRTIQFEFYKTELDALKLKRTINKQSSLFNLRPYLDENEVLRVTGRLQFLSATEDEKHPIIIPRESRFTYLLVLKIHKDTKHSGVSTMITILRKRFWIPRIRPLVKNVVNNCVICKRMYGKPLTEIEAPLPKDRLQYGKTFEVVGVDFAGPLFAKDCSNKFYIVLFTCATVRAIHLEIVPSLTVEDFIRSLRRFVARRGLPSIIYSDNAKTYKRSAFEITYLNALMESPKFVEFLTNNKIKWKNIVERAPWWGGFWERLIRSVKNCLKLSLGRMLVNLDELQTVLIEVESIVNSRPLSYIEDDIKSPLPLTPNNFLTDSEFFDFPTVTNYNWKEIKNNVELFNLWKSRQRLRTIFWDRWRTEYLHQLRSSVKNETNKFKIKIGDVILIGDKTPRLTWKLGKVEELFVGRDNRIRACKLRLASGQSIQRAIQLIYPLEIHCPAEDVGNKKGQT